MSNELISIKAWAEKHSFDLGDTFDYLKGKTLDGILVKSINTKVSEAALDSFKGNVLNAQKRKAFTVDISKVVDPAVLARIQKSKQEKAIMRNRPTGYSGNLRIRPRQTENKIQASLQDILISAMPAAMRIQPRQTENKAQASLQTCDGDVITNLKRMRNIAIGLNELKKENSENFIISPYTTKNKLKFIGLFGLFKKLDLLDRNYLPENVKNWLDGHEKIKPNFQDDIYSLVKSFEEHLRKLDNVEAKKILEKGLAEVRTDRFSNYNDLIDLLDNICKKKLKVFIKDSPTEEFKQVLAEMNKHCEFSIEEPKPGDKDTRVSFYTNNWQGTFFVRNDHIFIPHWFVRNDFKIRPIADISFSLDGNESSTSDYLVFFRENFKEKSKNSNQLESISKMTVKTWHTMPEKEKEFIEKNAFSVNYENITFEGANVTFSLSGDSNDIPWKTISKCKYDKTSIYALSPNFQKIEVGIMASYDINNKKLTITDIQCKKEEIGKEGKLIEEIHQKTSQFKKQMDACENFLKRNVANPILCSILSTPNERIPHSKELTLYYEDFKVFNKDLQTDETQRDAVLEAINSKPLYIIQGPPGTGKTTVIVECIRQIIERKPSSKILVTSQTNLAVDNVLEKILEVKPELKFMRLASENEDREMKVTEAIKPHIYEAKLKRWVNETIESNKKFMENKFSTQEKYNHLFDFYNTVQGDTEFNKFKEKLNRQPNNRIKTLFEDSKTMDDVWEKFNSVFGKEYLKLKDIGREWIAFLNNATNKNEKQQSKLNNGSEEINFLTAMIKDMSIIGATCIHIASSKYSKINFKFDYVIMDESSKASPAETLVPINMGKNIILIGDHKQLPPVVTREPEIRENVKIELDDEGLDIDKVYGKSLFEELITAFEVNENNHKYVTMLDTQYRMPKQIGDIISEFFYDGKLKNSSLVREHGLNLKKETSIVFLSTSEMENRNDNGIKSKRENKCNMEYIERILEKLNELYADNQSLTIGIIAGYRGQVDLLKNNIKIGRYENFAQIEINTVDGFQGAERDIIIYDIVRSDKGDTNIGFLDDDRRINVAFSRAKCLLIIVGDSEYIIEKAKPNPGEGGIFKKFKLKEIAKRLKEEGFIFNSLEEVF